MQQEVSLTPWVKGEKTIFYFDLLKKCRL